MKKWLTLKPVACAAGVVLVEVIQADNKECEPEVHHALKDYA